MAKNPRRIRTEYDPDYNPSDYGLSGFEPTLTKQSDAPSADINNIVNRWMTTGILPTSSNEALSQFIDVSDVPDYRGCLDIVIQAQNMFSELPSSVRSKFNNDPATFLDFAHNPSNLDAMVEMGLLSKRAAEPSTGGASAHQKAGDATPVDGSD